MAKRTRVYTLAGSPARETAVSLDGPAARPLLVACAAWWTQVVRSKAHRLARGLLQPLLAQRRRLRRSSSREALNVRDARSGRRAAHLALVPREPLEPGLDRLPAHN